MCYTRQTRSGLKSDSPGILCDCVSFSMLTCSVQKYFPQVAIFTTWCSVHECPKSFLYIYILKRSSFQCPLLQETSNVNPFSRISVRLRYDFEIL